jgi:hypothetical protein
MESVRHKETTTDGRAVVYGQDKNGMYYSTIRDAHGAIEAAITAPTMALVGRWWADHNIDFLNITLA